ncbi:MAG: SMI1/KNR4 family protein [Planctomycetota bacterium]|nr:MAG: SMI1/KNR4 family protein [Planctomycetota bacterium]
MSAIDEAYRKYSIERFPLPREAQLEALERDINVTFPEDYRRFVLQYNGGYFNEPAIRPVDDGCPLESLSMLYGIGASHEEAELGDPASLSLFEENDPPIAVPIGDTGTGGLILIHVEAEGAGRIFLKQAFGDFFYLADGIEEFFGLLYDPPWGEES